MIQATARVRRSRLRLDQRSVHLHQDHLRTQPPVQLHPRQFSRAHLVQRQGDVHGYRDDAQGPSIRLELVAADDLERLRRRHRALGPEDPPRRSATRGLRSLLQQLTRRGAVGSRWRPTAGAGRSLRQCHRWRTRRRPDPERHLTLRFLGGRDARSAELDSMGLAAVRLARFLCHLAHVGLRLDGLLGRGTAGDLHSRCHRPTTYRP